MDNIGLAVAALGILVLLSAFFSSAETAFISQRRVWLRHRANEGSRVAAEIERLLDRPARLLSTILLGNNLVNVAAASVATTVMVALLGPQTGVIAATASITVLLLIFGEIGPKVIAVHYPYVLAALYAYPIRAVAWVSSPGVAVLGWVAERVSGLLGERERHGLVREEDVRAMAAIGLSEGTVEPEEAEMVERVFRFSDRQVREVMTPRLDIIWVEERTTFVDFLPIYLSGAHTRFPVFRGEHDDVVGVLAVKDVLIARAQGRITDHSVVTSALEPPLFVPETKKIGPLFAEMRTGASQMALVVDEFGVLTGLVTVTQLIEEIIGDIGDDSEEEVVEQTGPDTFMVDGTTSVEEANEDLGLSLPLGDYHTVAGFLLDLLGHVPEAGEEAVHGDLTFKVEEMDGARIDRILVTRQPGVEG